MTRFVLLALIAATGGVARGHAQTPDPAASAGTAQETRRFEAAEARQAVAVDARHFYAIDNRTIGKYDRTTGARVGGWQEREDGPIRHLNSGVVVDGRLYAAHSNYPARPMVSSVEIWDVETMRHVGSHSFGIHAGSGTWVDRHDGAWWVLFANYENDAGEPGRGVEWTVLERYDDQWRRTGGWVLPPELVARMRPYSSSGGVWTSDGRLLLTGHDAPELYVLQLPEAGSVLRWTSTIRGTHAGQGVARDPEASDRIWAIDRASRTVRVLQLPAAGAGADGPAPPLNVAHRGASGHAPEHTFAAYDLALRMGADYIEQDLQLTKDGVLVALHDATLDRTARGAPDLCRGPVIERTFDEIRRCDAGSWYNERFPERARREYAGLRIPTLEEVFGRYGRGTRYYIETKNPEAAPGMEARLVELLDRYGLRELAARDRRVLVQSFSAASLRKLHEIAPDLPLVQLFGNVPADSIRKALPDVAVYAVGIGPAKGSVDADLVRAAHTLRLQVHPYTVNSAGEMATLLDLGVDGMFTNFPDVLVAETARRASAARRE